MEDKIIANRAPVCFFDSGIGGIALMNECIKLVPGRRFVYFSDNAHVPYGSLSCEELLKTVDVLFSEIEAYKPAAAVIACNTVTASCAEFLRAKYAFPIIGIQPAVKPAAANANRCVVLATPSTACSPSVAALVKEFGRGVTEAIACPELASYIEYNVFRLDENKVFGLLPDTTADSAVLGCTHYYYIKEIVRRKYGCKVYDGFEGTAKRLKYALGSEREGGLSVEFARGDTMKNEAVFKMLSGCNR